MAARAPRRPLPPRGGGVVRRATFPRRRGPRRRAGRRSWPARHTLVFAPTGSGKTLAAFLAAIDRLMFSPVPDKRDRCRVLYVSPLRALAVDVERNLRAPLAASRGRPSARGDAFHVPTSPCAPATRRPDERARMVRQPPDILITTPESLFLRAHLAGARDPRRRSRRSSWTRSTPWWPPSAARTSRSRWSGCRRWRREPLAAHRPLARRSGRSRRSRASSAAARAGARLAAAAGRASWTPACARRSTSGSRCRSRTCRGSGGVTEPADDEIPKGPRRRPHRAQSIWPAIHPRLLELIRAHRSTIVFVNSRRLAERLAGRPQRAGRRGDRARPPRLPRPRAARRRSRTPQGRPAAGDGRHLVAGARHRHGRRRPRRADRGAALGGQRPAAHRARPATRRGRSRAASSSRSTAATSSAAAAITRAMQRGRGRGDAHPAEPAGRPRPADRGHLRRRASGRVDELFDLVRRAAPFAELPRAQLEGVLDMLSGRYPSDEFAELRPRITWDRLRGTRARARRARSAWPSPTPAPSPTAASTACSWPTAARRRRRAASARPGGRRVGELDEEMVFESRAGEVFVLGASTWRIDEITRDRVLVVPAPGEPGKMPFWHGDRPARPVELGRAIGRLTRELAAARREEATRRLVERARPRRARGREPRWPTSPSRRRPPAPSPTTARSSSSAPATSSATGACACSRPSAGASTRPGRSRCRRGCARRWRRARWRRSGATTASWCACPTAKRRPTGADLLPDPDEVEDLVVRRARRHRALRRPLPRGGGARAAPAAAAARASARRSGCSASAPPTSSPWPRATAPSPSSSRPTASACRTCSTCPRLSSSPGACAAARSASTTVDTATPSPFAASLLFGYVANYIYDGDAPLAERRAQALAVDQRPAARAAGRGRAARAARPARRLVELERRAAGARRRPPRAERRPPARSAAAPRRSRRRTSSLARVGRRASRGRTRPLQRPTRWPRMAGRAAARAPDHPRPHRRRGAARRGRGRGPPTATPSASRRRPACPRPSWSRRRCARATSSRATRARTGRSGGRRGAPLGLGEAPVAGRARAPGRGRARARRASSARRRAAASGATPTCSRRCAPLAGAPAQAGRAGGARGLARLLPRLAGRRDHAAAPARAAGPTPSST